MNTVQTKQKYSLIGVFLKRIVASKNRRTPVRSRKTSDSGQRLLDGLVLCGRSDPETFAEAGVTARKAIFAVRLRRVPLIEWLLGKLRNAERQQISRSVIKTELEREILSEEVEHQIDIAVDWGRYAELLAYDDAKEMLYLEPAGATVG